MYCWMWFVAILSRIWASVFILDISLSFLCRFFFFLCVWLLYQGTRGFIQWIWTNLGSILEDSKKDFSKCLVYFNSEAIVSGIFFVGRLLMMHSSYSWFFLFQAGCLLLSISFRLSDIWVCMVVLSLLWYLFV